MSHPARRQRWTATLILVAVSAADAYASALRLDNANPQRPAYVTFGNAAALGLGTFTIELWFNRLGPGRATTTGTGGVTAVPLVTKGRSHSDGSILDLNWFLGLRVPDNVLVAD